MYKKMFNSNKLIGNKYTLNPLTKDDITEEYIAWLNDPIVNRFLEVRHVHQTIETVTEYINGFYKDQEKYIWGIYSLDGIMIGTISLFEFNRNHNSSVFGLMIGDSNYWGKSASEESIRLALNFAFDTLGLHRVSGVCYSTNMGMIFTFQRLGFKREGVMRKSLLDGGKYIDNYQWAVISDEWKNGQR